MADKASRDKLEDIEFRASLHGRKIEGLEEIKRKAEVEEIEISKKNRKTLDKIAQKDMEKWQKIKN